MTYVVTADNQCIPHFKRNRNWKYDLGGLKKMEGERCRISNRKLREGLLLPITFKALHIDLEIPKT